jgi:hypothetical protein
MKEAPRDEPVSERIPPGAHVHKARAHKAQT